jgi:RNA polymerase sigma-70 factor (sigma-E family)
VDGGEVTAIPAVAGASGGSGLAGPVGTGDGPAAGGATGAGGVAPTRMAGGVQDPGEMTFDELYRRDFTRLVSLAHGLSGSRAAAEELAQEAFLAAHRRWDRIGAYDDPSAWLRRVVVNRSVSVVRRRVAEAVALARLGGHRQLPDALPEHDEAVWRAVRRLPPRQAQVVALYYVDDRSVAEVAAILGCAEGTVKAHLHQARRSLARTLGHPVTDEPDEPGVRGRASPAEQAAPPERHETGEVER